MPWTNLLFSQVVADSLSGGAGWVGAGLLGMVLSWLLMIHLPAKDKQINEMVKTRDELADRLESKYESALNRVVLTHSEKATAIVASHAETLKEQRQHHETMMKLVIDHCDRENKSLSATMDAALDEITKAVMDLRCAIEDKRMQDLGNKRPA